jgi:hypothetical protein
MKQEIAKLHKEALRWARLLNSGGPEETVTAFLLQYLDGHLVIIPCWHDDLIRFVIEEVFDTSRVFSLVYRSIRRWDGLPCVIAATFSDEGDLLTKFSGKDGKIIFEGVGDVRNLLDQERRRAGFRRARER